MTPDAIFLIWSFEHDSWWRPGEAGYSRSIILAGRYPLERAVQISANANLTRINEAVIPVGPLARIADDASLWTPVARRPQPGHIVALSLNCRLCLKEKPADQSIRDFARLEVGLTDDGRFQVWCVRHEKEVFATEPETLEIRR